MKDRKCPKCNVPIVDNGSCSIHVNGKYHHTAHLGWCPSCKNYLIDHECNCEGTCKENKLHNLHPTHICSDCKMQITCNEVHGDKTKIHVCVKTT